MRINNIKHILKVLFLVFSVSFVVDKIIFVTLNKISDKVYTGQAIGKLNHFLKIKETKKFLIFGNSRANHNIDPNKIEQNSFNMGVDGRGIAFITTLIKTIENKETQKLLIQLDPESAFDSCYKGDDIGALAVRYNRNPIIRKEIDKINMSNPFQKIFKCISYNNKIIGILSNYLKPKYNYNLYNGYDPIYVEKQQRTVFLKILNQNTPVQCQERLSVNKLYYNYILELIDFSKKNNKEIIFFTSPIYKDECKRDNAELERLLKELNVIYFDFTDVFLPYNDLSFWKDNIHLSNIGAEKFTDIIKAKLSTVASK